MTRDTFSSNRKTYLSWEEEQHILFLGSGECASKVIQTESCDSCGGILRTNKSRGTGQYISRAGFSFVDCFIFCSGFLTLYLVSLYCDGSGSSSCKVSYDWLDTL